MEAFLCPPPYEYLSRPLLVMMFQSRPQSGGWEGGENVCANQPATHSGRKMCSKGRQELTGRSAGARQEAGVGFTSA